MTAASLIALTIPAKIIRVSNTTLFRVAELEFGDATLWEKIADLNGLTDPWITGHVELKIPSSSQVGARG